MDFVPVLAILEDVFLERALNFVAALFAVCLASSVEAEYERTYLPQVEGMEGIVQKKHLRFTAISLTPIALLADDRAGGRRAVLPVDAMEAHGADRFVGLRVHNDQDDLFIIAFLMTLDPLDLTGFGDGKIHREKLRDLLVVHPLDEEGDVLFRGWTKVEFPALQKYYATIVFRVLLHVIILSKSEFAGLGPWPKMKTSAFVQPRWFESS